MAQKAIFFTTGATGDGASSYTQAEVIRWMRQLWLGNNADEGVMKNYLNELSASGAVSPVAVNTGAAIVYGFPYWNTVSENVTIPTPAGSTRVDLIVLRADWTAQTVRLTRIAGTEGAGPPSLTQTDGVLWDLPLWQASITTGGAITLTDQRAYVHPNIEIETQMLVDGFDGDGIKIAAGALDIEPADFAGAGLEDDGSDNLRISAAAAGVGLIGGAGSALAVNPGTGLEISGDTVRIAAAAAGDGLIGGGGSALEVNDDNSTLEISGDVLRVKDDGIDDTKAGDRIIQMYRRQGGDPNDWDVQGATTYTPGAVRMQCGTARRTGGAAVSGTWTVTFPVAFSQDPVVYAVGVLSAGGYLLNIAIQSSSTTGFQFSWGSTDGSTTFTNVDVMWLAIGPE